MVNERLLKSQSAYLRLAIDHPINWYTWSEEAFEIAKKENKPILVDVGAAWCHWCHVMDEETYKDPEVVKLVNENFIPIKVDRDEMPDVDRMLQNAVFTLTGESGWPLTAFLTPDGKIFFGGTYYPPVDRQGRMGFRRLLKTIIETWKTKREEIFENAADPKLFNVESFNKGSTDFVSVENAVSYIMLAADLENGGLENNMKFPHPSVDILLLNYSIWAKDTAPRDFGIFTLKQMYYGGIFDQVGGGFHRYTVDKYWSVPHFEKLLIDNAELIQDYTSYYLYTGDLELLDALSLTVRNVLNDFYLKDKEGFAISIDADSEGVEGKYYTWTDKEIYDVIENEEERKLVRLIFDLNNAPLVEGRKVLHRGLKTKELAQALQKDEAQALSYLNELRNKLLEYRNKTRKFPYRDENLYTYQNCRIVEALLYAYPITNFGLKEALNVVNKVTGKSNITRRLDGGKEGLDEDYYSAILSLISAYEITGDAKYEYSAINLAESINKKPSNVVDMPNESSASMYVKGMLKLAQLSEDFMDFYEEIKNFSFEITPERSAFLAGILNSIGSYIKGIAHVIVIDEKDGNAEKLHRKALETYYPFKVVEKISVDRKDELPSYVREMIRYQAGKSRAYVCVGTTCSMPIVSPEKIQEILYSRLKK